MTTGRRSRRTGVVITTWRDNERRGRPSTSGRGTGNDRTIDGSALRRPVERSPARKADNVQVQ
jgi:hypothetical protein